MSPPVTRRPRVTGEAHEERARVTPSKEQADLHGLCLTNIVNYPRLQDIDLSDVDECLDTFVRAQQSRSPGARDHGAALWNEVLDHTRSGKRLRSRLVLLSAGTVSGALPVAAAYGLLHASFILHDDVIDRDDMRYGRPSLHAAHAADAAARGMPAEHATHRGYTRSILAGDLALGAAYRLLLSGTEDLEAPVREQVLRIFHDTVVTTTLGELLDVELSLDRDAIPSPAASADSDCPPAVAGASATASSATVGTTDPCQDALLTAEMKTAVYTFQAPLMSGALLAGLGPEQVEAAGRIGTHLGLAYQLEDDVQGVFGDQESTGKPVGGDLREGKHTHLMATALTTTSAPEVRDLLHQAALSDDGRLVEITAAMRDLLTRSGALAATTAQIRANAEAALGLLDSTPLPEPLASTLSSLAEQIGGPR